MRLAGLLQRLGAGGEFGGGGAQQRLGVLGVAGPELLGQLGVRLAVLGREPLGLAAQPARAARWRWTPGSPGVCTSSSARAAAACREGPSEPSGDCEQLVGAGADLVAEPVEFGEGGALVALRAGLLGAQVGADADLLVQLGGGPVGLAQRGQRRPWASSVVGPAGTSSGAPAISARSARSARAVRRASSAARWAARRSSSAARARSRQAWARASDSAASSASSRSLDLPAGALAQPEGESGEGVGGAPGLLRGLLALVAGLGGLGGGLVGLRAHGARLGQLGLGLLGEGARRPRRPGASSASRPAGQPVRQEASRAASSRSLASRAASARISSSRSVARARSACRSSSAACSSCMAGFGGTRKTSGPPPESAGGVGASRAAAVPTATAERGSSAASPSASRARAWVPGSVMIDAVDQFGPGGEHARRGRRGRRPGRGSASRAARGCRARRGTRRWPARRGRAAAVRRRRGRRGCGRRRRRRCAGRRAAVRRRRRRRRAARAVRRRSGPGPRG